MNVKCVYMCTANSFLKLFMSLSIITNCSDFVLLSSSINNFASYIWNNVLCIKNGVTVPQTETTVGSICGEEH